MRIVLASVRYPPAPGGAETHVAALAEGFVQRGHDVVVHTSDLHTEYPFVRRELPAEVNGVRVVRHPARRLLGSWTTMPSMMRALDEEARTADVLHAHSYGYYQTLAAARAARRHGTPYVFTPHFHPPWSMEGGPARRILRSAYDATLGRYALSRADRVIGVSTGEMAVMREFLPLREETLTILPNGFHSARFRPRPDGAAFRARLGIAAEEPLVLFAGRLASNKGLQHLVPAFAALAREMPRARLVLAGEDQGWGTRLASLAREHGVEDRVRFTGHLPDAAYREALASADLLVLPSEWEAFGIVLAEAMACGVPCVATRVGGAPDVVLDGETGLLVPYGDEPALAEAMRAILSDPALARRMGKAGEARAFTEFSWDAVVERTLALYGDVLASRRR